MRGLKIIPFVFLLLIFHKQGASQNIEGAIKDEAGVALQNVIVILQAKNRPAILAYDISNKGGGFKFNQTSKTDTLLITSSLIGFSRDSILLLPGKIYPPFSITLHHTEITLKEVKVKALPVWQRKDSLNYNVSEFKQPQDKVIGDVIARLPGIEVSPGGQIKYNGKPINKFYIEGLDLLEDRYGIANKNIPAESVETVQVLENHQPIRVLDSISYSDRAALNIKLKSSAKIKLIHRARLGIGASSLLSEDELVQMLFKQKLQFINTYKYNNTGLDNSRELNAQNVNEYINAIQNGVIKSDLVYMVQPNAPPISQRRYLFNNDHVISINQLMPLNSVYQLRINTSYINSFQKQQGRVTTKFYLPSGTTTIREDNKAYTNLNLLQTDLSLIANSTKFYLKDVFKFQGQWSSEKNRTITDTETDQQISNPFFNMSNDFKIIKAKTKYIKEWSSYLGYVTLPQHLDVYPGLYTDLLNDNLPYDALIQEASLNTFYTDNYFSLRKRKAKLVTQYKLGFNIQAQGLVTELVKNVSGAKQFLADTFQNKLNWQRYRIYEENNWSYENNKWRFALSLPFNYIKIDYRDAILKASAGKKGFAVNPGLTIIFQINPMWNISTAAFYNRDFGDISGITSGYILKTYRNLSNNNAPLGETKSGNFSATFTFRNPLKIIFFNAGIMLSRSRSNLIYQQQFKGNLETLTALVQNNYKNAVTISGRFSKYIINCKTSIGINYSYTFSNQQQLQENKLVTFGNTNYIIGINMGIKFSSKITTDYSGTFFSYLSKSQLQRSATPIQSASQNFSLNYFPTVRWVFRMTAEQYYVNNSFSASHNYYFADLAIRCKPKKSKLNYEFSCQNLFNTKLFSTAFLSNNIETLSEYRIRPRQMLFKIDFPF
jgi:hypothetical protein